MKNVLIVGLVLVGIGAGFAGGYYFKSQIPSSKPQKTEVATQVQPSPAPDRDKYASDRATVKSVDAKKLVYVLENGQEKTVENTGVTVWVNSKDAQGKPVQSDWKTLKVGDKLIVASEKATGKVNALLVL